MQHSSKSKVDWENLLPELLAVIAKRLTSTLDYTSFRGVCNSWRSVATFDNFDHAFPRVPWLMFTKYDGTKFFDQSKNKIFGTAKFAEAAKEKAIYNYLSCSGWLLGDSKSSVRICLTHPLSCISIKLPDLNTFPRYRFYLSTSNYYFYSTFIIMKMVLSGSPTFVSDLVIMVIWGYKRQLAFSRPGDSAWTLMEQWDEKFRDIVYYNEKLYAIDDKLRVVECDIHGPNPTRMQRIVSIAEFYRVDDSWRFCYMVESSGKLLIVSVNRNYKNFWRVFEFDLMAGSHKEINDLGDKTLFLSDSSPSMCLEGFAWNDEVKRNCIYDAYSGTYFDMGKGHHENFFGRDFFSEARFLKWVVPGF